MSRDTRYDVLFEPVRIGPVTARNRFYQVPHCNGMGRLRPRMLAAFRGMKAEGGWGVVCTEWCSIHPASDDSPYMFNSMWNEADIKANALMTERVHEHGALAGVELWFGGGRCANMLTREVGMDVSSMPNLGGNPFQSRAMDKADIRALRRWHRDAARRARTAGFDIVYVYATHNYLLSHFLWPMTNDRTDEYGGSIENRVRLVRELIEDTKDAVGDSCAVAVRFSADDGGGPDGIPVNTERRDMLEMLGELPDLWDINIADYSVEMGVSRFVREAALEPYMAFVKSITSKPVVTVGRFTSPDTMVSQVRRGITDLIGAARPSIADPFLPRKIEEGRIGDIRECIGCNICFTGDQMGGPVRCTQNPTTGEEWRRGWHPERIAAKCSDARVLIVGAGPAGLEAASALGQRGYQVMLAEAARELGGRVTIESRLPGLGEWARVRDYRVRRIEGMTNVEVYRESELDVDNVLEIGADHVAIATGAHWRSDGFGRFNRTALAGLPAGVVYTPDDIMAGRQLEGRVVVFDDDHYYMGAVVAERLLASGVSVGFVTPGDKIAAWAGYTNEQGRSQRRLIEAGVDIVTAHGLTGFDGAEATLQCVYSGRLRQMAADAVVMVTARRPNDTLYRELKMRLESGATDALKSVTRFGDCEAPAIIAAAVYAGHRYAREFEDPQGDPARVPHDRVFDEAP